MKKKNLWLGILAITLVFGMTVVACKGGGGADGGPETVTYTGKASGTTYTLKITENSARYTAEIGDTYELTGGGKRSAGKVDDVSDNELTLKPSNATTTFTAAISESGLTSLDGMIKWSDGTTAVAPGTLTGTGSTSDGGGGDGGGGGGGSGGLGNTLTLSGQVYTQEYNISGSGNLIKYEPYTGSNKTFTSDAGGSGSITNGKMSFSIGTPSASTLEPFKFDAGTAEVNMDVYSNIKVSPSDARGASVGVFSIDLLKENINMSINANTGAASITIEVVMYTYVDKNCTITATGKKVVQGGINLTYPNINLNLKKGWNAMNVRVTSTSTGSGTGTGTAAISTGDLSSCKWVLGSEGSYSPYY